jgi:hypothetical protein
VHQPIERTVCEQLACIWLSHIVKHIIEFLHTTESKARVSI